MKTRSVVHPPRIHRASTVAATHALPWRVSTARATTVQDLHGRTAAVELLHGAHHGRGEAPL
eukprot:SAG22_NODE_178_length_16142_cov_13.187995_18_plen_62_part_00